MTALDARPAPDLAAIKQKQQATWASGDYHLIGTQIVITSELLLESLDLHAGERVLDVATGSGNAALAAARRGGDVTGVDYVPSLLAHARARADAEFLDAAFVEGDAEALPFEDGAFDVVTSVFGAMFAPDQERTAAELARVTRPGGRIGLVAHTPEGYIGQLFKVVGSHVPPAPGLRSPVLWGTDVRLAQLFGDRVLEMTSTKRLMVFRYRPPEAYLAYWRRFYGPIHKAFQAVGPDGEAALGADLLALVASFNEASDGTMIVRSEYLETVITTR